MTAAFSGWGEHNLDDKGRVIVPSKFRDQIDPEVDGPRFVATVAPEPCVFLFTDAEWKRMNSDQSHLPRGISNLRKFQRLWHGQAEGLSLDKQGRIQLPKRLRDHARLEKEVVLVGCFDRIEVWSKAEWERELSSAQAEFGSHVAAFLSGGPNESPAEA